MAYYAQLNCFEDLICDGDDYISCANGSGYQVDEVTTDGYYVIYNDKNQRHLFSKNKSSDSYYGNWFELELEVE